MSTMSAKRSLAAALGLGLCVVCGCGVGEYSKRMESGLSSLKQGSVFKELGASKDVPGTKVSLRLPPALSQTLSKGATVEGAVVDDARLTPAGLEWPALKETYEAFIPDSEKGKIPYYLYVSVPDPGSTTFDKVKTLVITRLGDRFAEGRGEWQDEAITTPEGGSINWKKLRATGEQDFLYVDPSGKASTRKMKGIVDAYLCEQGGVIVLLAWRVPESIEQNARLAELSKLVCGAVAVKE